MTETNETLSHTAKDGEILWLYSMGKRFQIRAIFTDDDSSNAYMARHDETALIAEFGPFRIVANKYAGVKD